MGQVIGMTGGRVAVINLLLLWGYFLKRHLLLVWFSHSSAEGLSKCIGTQGFSVGEQTWVSDLGREPGQWRMIPHLELVSQGAL